MSEQAGFLIEKIVINGKEIKPMPKGFTGLSFNYSYSVDSAVSESIGRLRYNVEISILEEGRDIVLAYFNIFYFFKGENLDKILHNAGSNLFQIPSNIDNVFKLIALDSTRGIIFSELRGTYLDNVILPIIDANAFIENQNALEEKIRKK